MAQSGIFHTSMRGFNKREVLQYVEELNARVTAEQEAATEEIARLQQQVNDLREELDAKAAALAETEENAAQLQQLVDEYRHTVQQLGNSAEQVDSLNREKLELHARCVRAEQTAQEQQQQIETLKAESQRLAEENASLSELQVTPMQRQRYVEMEEKCRLVLAENRRYRALIGHVGTFVAEVRRMNQGILDATYCRETEIIDAADTQLTKLTERLEENRRELATIKEALTERRDAADTRLAAMMEQLEQNAQPDGFSPADA